jgi:chromatin assembly factor 1 subunit A
MDDWLVDDLEEEDDDGSLPLDDLDVFGSGAKMEVDIPSPFSRLQPAKPAGVNMLQPKKKKIKPIGRRFEKKLVPFSTGPHWEQVVGESIYEGFVNYQIEFLNGE